MLIALTLLSSLNNISLAQNSQWEFERSKSREEVKQNTRDSLMISLKSKWQLSFSYGQWFAMANSRTSDVFNLDVPKNMSLWRISLSRFFSETISLNANFGIQIRKVEPEQPDIFSVINGADIDIEGGGVNFIPITIGANYYLRKKQFRPYIGLGLGVISARSKIISGTGNISNGINQSEYSSMGKSLMFELGSGLLYRIEEHIQFEINFKYSHSGRFENNVFGFNSYRGLNSSIVLHIVL